MTDTEGTSNFETDSRFPSGEWTGFFLQPRFFNSKIWMSLWLSFSGGKISGEGKDRVGEFIISGRYDLDSGKVWMTARNDHRGAKQ